MTVIRGQSCRTSKYHALSSPFDCLLLSVHEGRGGAAGPGTQLQTESRKCQLVELSSGDWERGLCGPCSGSRKSRAGSATWVGPWLPKSLNNIFWPHLCVIHVLLLTEFGNKVRIIFFPAGIGPDRQHSGEVTSAMSVVTINCHDSSKAVPGNMPVTGPLYVPVKLYLQKQARYDLVHGL